MTRISRLGFVVLHACVVATALAAAATDASRAVAQERSERGDRGESRERRDPTAWRRSRSDRERDRDERREERPRRDEEREPNDDGEKKDEPKEDAKDSATSSTGSDAYASYARGLVKELDMNGNQAIDGDELVSLREPARSADFNKDGFITSDEIAARVANPNAKPAASTAAAGNSTASERAPAASGESASEENRPDENKSEATDDNNRDRRSERRRERGGLFGFGRGDSDQNSDDDGDSPGEAKAAGSSKRVYTWTSGQAVVGKDEKQRRTYRFTPAGERLPTGLPSWFKSQDKNNDGQVAMSEYSRTWSRSTVSRFQRYDLDGDGLITAKEAAGKE